MCNGTPRISPLAVLKHEAYLIGTLKPTLGFLNQLHVSVVSLAG